MLLGVISIISPVSLSPVLNCIKSAFPASMGDRPEGTVICVLSAEPEFCAKLTLALVIPVVLFTVVIFM